jgi:Putative lumazine-binding
MIGTIRWSFLSLALAIAPLEAQKAPQQEAILEVVKQLFDGMRAGDSALVRSTFHPQALLATAENQGAGAKLRIEALDTFFKAVGSPHDSVYDERTRNEIVHQDGTLAAVWVEYSFYVGSRFNHCGVDSFQLAKVGSEWKIVAITDTRRRRPCPEQP